MQKVLCSSEPRPELSVTGYIAVPGFPLLGKAAFTGLLRTRQPKLMYALVPRENAHYGVLDPGLRMVVVFVLRFSLIFSAGLLSRSPEGF